MPFEYMPSKKCPNSDCQSEDLEDLRVLVMQEADNFPPHGKYNPPSCPLYECRKCHTKFAVLPQK